MPESPCQENYDSTYGLINTTPSAWRSAPTPLRVDLIREALEYGGLRLRTTATVAGARTNIVVDIGFGDAIEPGIEEVDLPVLLGQRSPRLKVYARETVIAEKFQAMAVLGLANTRYKSLALLALVVGSERQQLTLIEPSFYIGCWRAQGRPLPETSRQ